MIPAMADWRDVMDARAASAAALNAVNVYGGQVEDGDRHGDLGMLLAATAICLELRALATLIDHARSDAR
jgi:hypothetical protein